MGLGRGVWQGLSDPIRPGLRPIANQDMRKETRKGRGVGAMTDFAALEDGVYAAPQLTAEEIKAARAMGVTTLVSNRVDGEEPGAPAAAQVQGWAEAEGLRFHHIPVVPGQITADNVKQMARALDETGDDGKLLVFCKTGGRSAVLWALARAAQGHQEPEALVAAAGQAGFDIRPLTDMLRGAKAQGLDGL
ncbi:TIGR01244 family protein [Rhodothalassium salexigens]|nr:TIGR01244 family protein [Rhodothalassium salexigens]MBK5920785.1 TIGR01244 family protein [Rhodothalassium salexigens]